MNFALFIGESTGLKILKIFIEKKINITYVCSVDLDYKKKITEICKNNKIPFFYNPSKKISNILRLNKKTDYIFSVFSRYIIPQKIITSIKKFGFNLHPGLLPYYPGTNSISGTLYNNEKETGITIHLLTKNIDKGKILIKKKN